MTANDRGMWFRALILIQFVAGMVCILTGHWKAAAAGAFGLFATIAVLLTIKE